MWFTPKLDVATPARSTPVRDLELLAVDIETTGTDPKTDHILSIGWLPVRPGGVIDFSGAGYVVVSGHEVGESAVIHGLTDADVQEGVPLAQAFDQVISALQGKALLAHFAALEVGFFDAAARALYGKKLKLQVVDTFALERRHMERMGTYPRGEDLRLARVRQRYELPRYGNHNALTDAQACAELYLALIAETSVRTLADLQP
ncbi:DNA polymerase III subunit epsilon [Corynebacterium phocae]|uniref:DNA polymerase III subunit epsilon n=1 Tax=Corynebacterium phocae TaxID=161895 RepID=A0A1L7D3I7_9CORY|nr:exonuclease domain-containing protein [Corynebacterium phocae]APT92670.1 DNA polymerase III subunit epsilon [Corynebacterium phocae]KAA8723558.1 DNA polymerase III subunit epsilon [Corynebacterium phocae]